MSSTIQEEFQLYCLSLNHQDVQTFTRSQWKLPPWLYLIWRLFWCVWHIVWLVVSGVRSHHSVSHDQDAVKWLVQLSNWTFLLTTIYCLVDFIVVVTTWFRNDRRNNSNEFPRIPAHCEKEEILFKGEFTLVKGIKIAATPWQYKLQWCLFETINCANLLSIVAYWASQHKDGDYLYADVVVFNIINIIFVISNTTITALPIRILHFIYPAAFFFIYTIFNLIYYLADGTSITGSDVIFTPLQWEKVYPTTFTLVVGFLFLIPLGHVIFFALFTVRTYLFEKLCDASTGNNGTAGSENVTGSYRRRNSAGVTTETEIENNGKDHGHLKDTRGRENAAFEIESEIPN